MRVFRLLLVIFSSFAFAATVYAQCAQDDAGFDNSLSENISIDDARTAQDFVNGAVNSLMTSNEGRLQVHFLFGEVSGQMLMAELSGTSTQHPLTACNEIGQCAQVDLTVSYGYGPSDGLADFANSVLGFISGGVLGFDEILTPKTNSFDFSATIGDDIAGTSFDHSELNAVTDVDPLPIESAGTAAAADDRCRDNDGNLLNGDESPPGGGGGGGGDHDGRYGGGGTSYRYVISSWSCGATSSGVMCRRTYYFIP